MTRIRTHRSRIKRLFLFTDFFSEILILVVEDYLLKDHDFVSHDNNKYLLFYSDLLLTEAI